MLTYSKLCVLLYFRANVSHVSDLERGANLCKWICYGSSSMCCAKALCNPVSNSRFPDRTRLSTPACRINFVINSTYRENIVHQDVKC